MNPFVEVHVHPAPERLPTDPDSIETITVRAPTRDRGLVIHDLDRSAALFELFARLVTTGELSLHSDADVVPALVDMGFLVADDDIIAWPPFSIELPDAPGLDIPAAPTLDTPAARVAGDVLYQRDFTLHPDIAWPADYAEQDGRLRVFAPGPAVWIAGTPYWLAHESDDDRAALARLVAGRPLPAMSAKLAGRLAAAGAIAGHEPPRRALPRFDADLHVIVDELVSPAEAAALRSYYRCVVAAGLVPRGDRQNRMRESSYNDPVGRFVQARLAGAMSAIAGQPVEPTFSYVFSYLPGAVLEPHKDRAQAEYSISLQLDYEPAPPPGSPTGWPLCFAFDDGRAAAADLALGQAVLYRGRDVIHSRPALPAGHRSTLLVLEYVPRTFDGLRI